MASRAEERPRPTLRFDDFELDTVRRILSRHGIRLKLQPQPFRVLELLIASAPAIVAREELAHELWGDEVHVDVEQNLNYCVRQIRVALRDEASQPVYIQTLPKQGYRFIGQVEAPASEAAPSQEPLTEPTAAGLPSGEPLPRPSVLSAPKRKLSPLLPAAAGLLLALAGAVSWRATVPQTAIDPPLRVTKVTKLTTYPGDERDPAVSPDGAYVAFSWSGAAGDNYDIYVVQASGQQPLRLTTDPAPDSYPAWSPDGRQIAFLRRNGPVSELVLVPPLGGPERVLRRFSGLGAYLDFSQHPVLTWSPDGKSIIYSGKFGTADRYQLFALSIETAAVRAISFPDQAFWGDSSPALSADGRFLAFARYVGPLNGRVLIQPLAAGLAPQGGLTDVTQSGLALHSPLWLDAGRLLFADQTHIFQWREHQQPVPIYAADGVLGGLSLGPKSRDNSVQLVAAKDRRDDDIWFIPLAPGGAKASGPPQVLQRSTESELLPDFSPDGRSIAFASTRGGSSEIWVADADGGNPRQLTHLGAHTSGYPTWSPDGKRIAFHSRVPDLPQIYIVEVNGGATRQITFESPGFALTTWSADGRSLYGSTLLGKAVTYRIPLDGGPRVRLWEGDWSRESRDGSSVLYAKVDAPGIFRRSLLGDPTKNPEERIIPDFWHPYLTGGYAPVASGIYYVSTDGEGRPGPFRYFDYASGKTIDVAPAMPGLAAGLTISPDRRRLVFAGSAEVGGDLLSLELR